MKVAIDIGNGYIKAINEKGERLHFPAVIKESQEESILKNKNEYEMQIDGKNYFFGNLAIIKRAARRWETGKSIHQDTEKYIALCAHLLSEEDKPEIELSLGLPYSYYIGLNRGEKLKEALLDWKAKTEMKGKKTIHIKKVSVYPQGVGAYFANLYDITGQPQAGAEDFINSIYIDVGYRTIDVVAFQVLNGTFELVEENSFSLEEDGMFQAMKEIARRISKDFEITENDVDFAIRHKGSVFESMYGEIDFKKIEQEEYQKLSEKIGTEINVKLSGDLPRYRNLFLTGGGADKLYPFMKKKYPHIQIQEDFIFCNAKGYLALENTKVD